MEFISILAEIKLVRLTGFFALAVGALGLSSCERVSNKFVVHDQNGSVVSAEVRLCGKQQQLTKNGNEVAGAMAITCEGEGNILLRLSDGREITCRIGYVTPGADQTFKFAVQDGHCR
jgi:hypothetical protein